MFFYKHVIDKKPLAEYALWLEKLHEEGKSTFKAKINSNLLLYAANLDDNLIQIYFLVCRNEVIAYCSFSKKPRWKALETTMLYVVPTYRHSGIALLIYDAIMKLGMMV